MELKVRKEQSCLTVVIIALVSLVAVVLAAGASDSALKDKKETDTGITSGKIMAKINGKPIYEEALTPIVQKELKKFQKFTTRKVTPDLEKRLQRKALEKVIGEELLYQEGQKLKIPAIEEKIAEKVKNERNKYQGKKHFENYLEAKGITDEDLRESARRSIYIDEYLRLKGLRDPNISEDELRAYYEDNKKNFQREETIRVRHILILVADDAGPEEKKQAKQKAEKVRKEILAGKNFAEMAKNYSEDGVASHGGDLGYIKRNYMPSEFDAVAFALEKNAVSEVVRTRHGYHIVQVLDKIPEGATPYDEVRDFIRKFLQGEAAKKNIVSHLRELKKMAKIEILIDQQ